MHYSVNEKKVARAVRRIAAEEGRVLDMSVILPQVRKWRPCVHVPTREELATRILELMGYWDW